MLKKIKVYNNNEIEVKLCNTQQCEPTFGEKLADIIASLYGSWKFIIYQSSLIIVWMVWNLIDGLPHFDEPPYIGLNLILSFIAAYTGTVLQMSSNRQSERDRLIFQHDYESDLRSEAEIRELKANIEELKVNIDEIKELLKK